MDRFFDYGDEDELESVEQGQDWFDDQGDVDGVENGLGDFQGDVPEDDELEEDEGEALIWGVAENEAFEAYNDYLEGG